MQGGDCGSDTVTSYSLAEDDRMNYEVDSIENFTIDSRSGDVSDETTAQVITKANVVCALGASQATCFGAQ